MNLEDVLAELDESRYENIKRAVELGKWADGRPLGKDERNTCLQILIAWDARHKSETERVGYIHREKHTACEDSHELAPSNIIHKT